MTSTHAISIAIVALLVFVVGSMDYEDRRQERAVYCQMVQDKTWPDFKNIYSKECPNNR